MYIVDASVWVARFISTDIYHERSLRWLGSLVSSGVLIISPAILLPELAGAVARRTGDGQLSDRLISLLQRLPNFRLVSLDAQLAEASAAVASDLRLRGADAVYAALASRLDIPLVTWDNEQLQRGRPTIQTITPGELLGK